MFHNSYHKIIILFIDLAGILIRAFGSENGKISAKERWKSQILKIYSPRCKFPRFLEKLKLGCEFKNYAFGPVQNQAQYTY